MEPSTDVSASRSWGGTLPGVSAIVAMTDALPVLSHDHIDVGGHVAVQLQRNLVLTQRTDGLLHVDLVPVDLDPMLSLEGAGDILVRDRAESLVLGPDPEAHDHRLVVDLVSERLRLDVVLHFALDHSVAQPLGFCLDALVSSYGQLARQQEVAAISVRDVFHVAGLADVRDILGQHHPHFSLALRYRLIWIRSRETRPDPLGESTTSLSCRRDSVPNIVIEDALPGLQRLFVFASHLFGTRLDERLDREHAQREHVQLAEHRHPGREVNRADDQRQDAQHSCLRGGGHTRIAQQAVRELAVPRHIYENLFCAREDRMHWGPTKPTAFGWPTGTYLT